MKPENFFRPKTKTELKEQVQTAEAILGQKVYPPGVPVSSLDITTIKEKYKTRYETYLAALRANANGVDPKEIKHSKEWITALNNLDTYIKSHESKTNTLLREKQYVVYKKIRDFLEQGKRKGYIKLPTGAGKTVLFLKIAEAMGMRTLIVSPSIIILGQNRDGTAKFTSSTFGEYHGTKKDLSGEVTHITYNSLVNAVKDGKIDPEDVPVLVLDEAHRSLGPERRQVINKFSGMQIGFTATAEFSEDKKVGGLLEEEIYRMDVVEGIREGLICNTQTIHAYTTIDLSSVKVENGKYDQRQLEKATNVQGRNMAAVELYQKKFRHLSAICNCSGVKHAEDAAKLFNEKGIPAACITGNTPKEIREHILSEYKKGKIKVLTNARVLLEGFDMPNCSVTLNLHPTLSLVDAEQRARSGRLDKDNPDKWSYVVDFIDKNNQKSQVLYSDILNSSKVWNLTKAKIPKTTELEPEEAEEDQEISEPTPPIDFEDFSFEGLKVVVDEKTIMEVTKANLDSREKWSFSALQADVRAKGIISSEAYVNARKDNQWPVHHVLTSMPEFPKKPDGSNDWESFLGTAGEKWTFVTLQADVRAKGVKSSKDYMNARKDNQWLAYGTLTAMPEFPKNTDGSNDWDTFLGIEKRKEWSFSTLQADVRAKGIISSEAYAKGCKDNQWPTYQALTSMPEFPKNPDGSNDWQTFFGIRKEPWKKRKEWTLEALQNDVRVKGIKSSAAYTKNVLKNEWLYPRILIKRPDFPKKSNGSPDWDTFLGRNKVK